MFKNELSSHSLTHIMKGLQEGGSWDPRSLGKRNFSCPFSFGSTGDGVQSLPDARQVLHTQPSSPPLLFTSGKKKIPPVGSPSLSLPLWVGVAPGSHQIGQYQRHHEPLPDHLHLAVGAGTRDPQIES